MMTTKLGLDSPSMSDDHAGGGGGCYERMAVQSRVGCVRSRNRCQCECAGAF